jgi:hypothetical protein
MKERLGIAPLDSPAPARRAAGSTSPDTEGDGDAMVLTEQDVEAVARRTVELLRGERAGSFALVGARELAESLGVSVDYVYEHASELGALRLGGGRKARIRFEVDTARRALEARRTSPEPPRKSGAQRR